MSDCVLTIDFGTSYFKTAVLDAAGSILCIDRVRTPLRREDERSEITPQVFRDTVRQLIRTLSERAPKAIARVRAVTFCTQANTFILLDSAEKPLTPLIVWNDSRAREIAAEFEPLFAGADYRECSGIPRVDACFAVMKLKWIERFDPAVLRRAKKLLFIGDYFTHWLTGQALTDQSVAALSGLFDVRYAQWSAAWSEKLGIDSALLPQVVQAGSTVGSIRPAIAKALGLPPGCLFMMGILDQYAGAIGVGNYTPGGLSETTGTVLATIRSARSFNAPASSDVFVGPGAVPGTFYHMTFGDVSAALLEYYRRQLPDQPSFETLDAAVPPAAGSLRLDHRLPLEALQAQIRAWAGVQPRGEVVACIYETVARALHQQVMTLLGNDPLPSCIRSAGGASRSRRWLQVKANTLGISVQEPQSPEPTLVGTAMLAATPLNWPLARAFEATQSAERLIYPEPATAPDIASSFKETP